MWEKSQIASNLLEEKYGDGKQKTLRLITSHFALNNRLTWAKKVCKQAQ